MCECRNPKETTIKLVHHPCTCSQCRDVIGVVKLCSKCGRGEFSSHARRKQSFWEGDIVEIQIDTGGINELAIS
jgi:hypothetical protein